MVAGIFTCGATWAVAGVVINIGGLLIGTAIRVAAGIALIATGNSYTSGIGAFVGIGSGPGSALLNIPLGLV